jgi:hypothetical protein
MGQGAHQQLRSGKAMPERRFQIGQNCFHSPLDQSDFS